MIPTDLSPLANHLWQSTLFAAAAWLLTLALRKNRAAVRYWIWLAASVKFLIPFSVLAGIGSRLGWRSAPVIALPQFTNVMNEIGRPFAALADFSTQTAAPPPSSHLPTILLGVWLCGFILGLIFWVRSLRQIRAIERASTLLDLHLPIPVMSSAARLEPGVFGIRKPVLLLPEGITGRLTPAQLEAVLAHELCHLRRRDNLTAAIHMVAETIFWFHPLVWWIRTQLVAERERACDEEVIGGANHPQVYAEAILNVCRLYIESPLVCVSGVTGANLKRRIEAILDNRPGQRLNRAKKLLLASAGVAALAGPLVIGIGQAPAIRAQSRVATEPAPALSFEAASVKALKDAPGPIHFTVLPNRLDVKNMSLGFLIEQAYDLAAHQLSGPDWIFDHRFDIAATSGTPVSLANMRAMLQSLLRERFHLATHWETRIEAAYRLVIRPGGPKMKAAAQGYAIPNSPMRDGNSLHLTGPMSMRQLAERLTRFAGKPVLDATNLEGYFAIVLTFASDDYDASGDNGVAPPLLTKAVEEQLGLKLVPGKEPIKTLVVDHADAVPVPN